jgi:hypothetical protein
MKQHLSCIRRTWRRLFVTVVIGALCFLNRLFAQPRRRMHWLGNQPRQRRPERAFIVLTFISAMILLEPRDFAIWAMMVGGATSCMVTVQSVRRLIPRRGEDWIK